MQRISTPYTFSIKSFPFVFFGFLAFFAFLLLINGALQKAPMFLVVVVVMAVIGFYSTKESRRDLVDEVDDWGDYLLVKKHGEENTVLLSNIINVNFSTDGGGASARITLTLASPGKFGTEISFAPPPKIYIGFPCRNEIAEDLLARADKARRGQLANNRDYRKRRDKTGMKQRMQNSYEKGPAIHSAPSLALIPARASVKRR
jgi:hypothetical protein